MKTVKKRPIKDYISLYVLKESIISYYDKVKDGYLLLSICYSQYMKMYKRKFDELDDNNVRKAPVKNSLDSDEEDEDANEDNYNIMSDDEIEGT